MKILLNNTASRTAVAVLIKNPTEFRDDANIRILSKPFAQAVEVSRGWEDSNLRPND